MGVQKVPIFFETREDLIGTNLAAPLFCKEMLNLILKSLQRDVADLASWWSAIPYTYRGAGCLLLALALMWDATKLSSEGHRDRKFFLTGMAALGLLAYAAMIFSKGNGNNN